jgi:hypothetical protein
VHEYRSALRCVPGDLHQDRFAGPVGLGMATSDDVTATALITRTVASADTTMLDVIDGRDAGARGFGLDAKAMTPTMAAIGSPLPTERGVVPYPRRANGVPRQVSRHRGASGDGSSQSQM